MTGAFDLLPLSAIAAGGIVGAWTRYALLRLALAEGEGRWWPFDPRIATLAANLLACALLGGLLAAEASGPASDDLRALAFRAFGITGVCGSLSTFSTLCAQVVEPLRHKQLGRTALFVLAHVVGGPLAFLFGGRLGG